LTYTDKLGKMLFSNQKDDLDALTQDKDRFVLDSIDKGDDTAIQELVSAFKALLVSEAAEEQVQEDCTTKKVMGTEAKDLL